MAFEAARAIVKFVADPSDLKGAVTTINGVLDRFKQRAEAAARTARRILAVGALAAAGVIALAATQAQAEARLEAVIRATGQASGFTADQLKEQAAALQELTAVGDEVIINAQAILATFKQIKGDIFREAILAALDMSAVLGQDLQSSVIQLGKALNDPILGITALSRVGVSFNKQQKEQIRILQEAGDVMGAQRVILEELQGEFGGAAKAIGETFAGEISKLKNSLGDLGEEVGKTLVPSLSAFLQRVKPIVPALIEWVSANGRTIVSLAAFSAGVLQLIVIIPKLIAVFQLLILNPVGLIITGTVIAFLALGQAFRDTGREGNIFSDILSILAKKLGLVSDELRALLDPVTPFKEAQKDFDDFQDALRKKFPKLGPFGGAVTAKQILGLDEVSAQEQLKILTEMQQKIDALSAAGRKFIAQTGDRLLPEKLLGGKGVADRIQRIRENIIEEIKRLNAEIDAEQKKAAADAIAAAKQEAEFKKLIAAQRRQDMEFEKQFFKDIEELRRKEMAQIKDRNKLLKEIELIGSTAKEREKILQERRRSELIERAKKAGFTDEQLQDLRARFAVEDIRAAAKPEADRKIAPPQFIGLQELFKRIQGARDPQMKIAVQVKELNKRQVALLAAILKQDRDLFIAIANKLGISEGDIVRNVFGEPAN